MSNSNFANSEPSIVFDHRLLYINYIYDENFSILDDAPAA